LLVKRKGSARKRKKWS